MEVVCVKEVWTFDHIISNIYLGDLESSNITNILNHNIAIVVNISNSRYDEAENVDYFHFDVDDDPSEDIGQYFNDFIDLVHKDQSKLILVHCANSVSRSVTLVLAYLIHSGRSLLEAVEFLKTRRTQYTLPNRGFIKQLSSFESSIHGRISIDSIDLYKQLRKKSIS
jgi:dual specificity phosphatase 12